MSKIQAKSNKKCRKPTKYPVSGVPVAAKKVRERDDISTMTALACGVSYPYVRRVLRMEKSNEIITEIAMDLAEGKKELLEKATEKAQSLTQNKKRKSSAL